MLKTTKNLGWKYATICLYDAMPNSLKTVLNVDKVRHKAVSTNWQTWATFLKMVIEK